MRRRPDYRATLVSNHLAGLDHPGEKPMRHLSIIIVISLILLAAPSRAETHRERGQYLVETVAGC
jgi:hypothetical protein